MKVAILSESPADEAAVRILVDALRGAPTDTVTLTVRTRGWPAVLNTLPAVLRHLHYRTGADAIVVVADSDDSPLHEPAHETSAPMPRCRLCQLRGMIDTELPRLRPIPGRSPLKTAVGLAVPAIEAWLLAGLDVHSTEPAWARQQQAGKRPYVRTELKERVYGVLPVPLAVETSRMIEEATRLGQNIHLLERLFPSGFGALARDVRNW